MSPADRSHSKGKVRGNLESRHQSINLEAKNQMRKRFLSSLGKSLLTKFAQSVSAYRWDPWLMGGTSTLSGKSLGAWGRCTRNSTREGFGVTVGG